MYMTQELVMQSLTQTTAQEERMNNSMVRLPRLTAVGALAAILALSMPRPAEAVIAIILDLKFGMVGLTRGQTARLNVAHIGDPNERGRSCSVQMSFQDSVGRTVAVGNRELTPGEASTLDLSAAAIGTPDRYGRVQIRGTVALGGPDTRGPDAIACVNNLRPTLEVFDDATGRTTVIIGK